MRFHGLLAGAAICAVLGAAGAASAATVAVDGHAGPWDRSVMGNPTYGVGDNIAAASLKVNAGDMITITYLSGLTSAFGSVPPTVDATGYVGGPFGSGADCNGIPCTGIGSSGQPFPSFYLDPTNMGPQIALNALIGDFVDSSGKILDEFAPGDGPFSITAPAGAVALQLGVNDDIFSDNSGSLDIGVTGSTAVPEPSIWAMMLMGFGGLGVMIRGGRRRSATAAV